MWLRMILKQYDIHVFRNLIICLFQQGPGDDYITSDDHLAQDGDLYDDVITTQSSGTDFTDITNTVNQNIVRLEQTNGLISGGHMPSGGYNGKRVSLYIGQLTWV